MNKDHLRSFLESKNCPECDLRNLELTEVNLEEAFLLGADLSNAKLIRCNLEGANLFARNNDLMGPELLA